MSGICGLVALAPPLAPGVEEGSGLGDLARALVRRGPDGVRTWRLGEVGLAHALLATTPEALAEAMPLHDAASGCTITADIRLDNREELAEALGLSPGAGTMGDGELVLRAYLHWGEPCLERLLGDFAFAIHDPRRRALFCARDPLGMRPLLWSHVPGRLFAFASETAALLAHPAIPRALDEGRIGDFLAHLEGGDRTSTFRAAIRRLPPGHSLTCTGDAVSLRRYWCPPAPPVLRLADDAAYEAAFREVLSRAVEARLRGVGRVGVLLSGGIDSGSVAALAAQALAREGRGALDVVSVTGAVPAACVESAAIAAMHALPGMAPHTVPMSLEEGEAQALVAAIAAADEPFDGQMPLIWAAYAHASRLGIRVMLDGAGADVVLGEGPFVRALVRAGRWRSAWREMRARRVLTGGGEPLWRALARGWGGALAPAALLRWRRRLFPPRGDETSLADPGFARRIGLAARQRRQAAAFADPGLSWQAARAEALCHPFLAVGRERYDRVAARFGIEPRDPFLDLRVIEFCLSLPPEQVTRHGLRKWILRRALRDHLPDAVTARRLKEHLGWDFACELLTGPVSRWWRAGGEPVTRLAGRVRAEALSGDWCEEGAALEDRFDLWHLSCWLERNR